MRTLVTIAAALALSMGTASAATSPAKTTKPAPQVAAMPVSLTSPAPQVGQIANCANLAAVRAMDAKAAGAGFEVQRRLLDFTFALCIAGGAQ